MKLKCLISHDNIDSRNLVQLQVRIACFISTSAKSKNSRRSGTTNRSRIPKGHRNRQSKTIPKTENLIFQNNVFSVRARRLVRNALRRGIIAFGFSRVITPFSFFVVFRCRVRKGLAGDKINESRNNQMPLLRQSAGMEGWIPR